MEKEDEDDRDDDDDDRGMIYWCANLEWFGVFLDEGMT